MARISNGERRRRAQQIRKIRESSGALFDGDETYPLSGEERTQFHQSYNYEPQTRFYDKRSSRLTPTESGTLRLGFDSLLDNSPTARALARESNDSGLRFAPYKFDSDSLAGQNPYFSTLFGIDIDEFETPENAAAVGFHEMYHCQQSHILNTTLRGEHGSDIVPQAISAQLATDVKNELGTEILGFDPAYHAAFNKLRNECLAYAQGQGERPDDAMRFKPKAGLSELQLQAAQEAYADQESAKIMRERFEKTFETELEDLRPGEHVMSLEIACKQERYRGQGATEEEQNAFADKYKLSNIQQCVQKEVERLGKDNPLSGAMQSALAKRERNKKLTPQEESVLQYAVGTKTPDLNEHHRNVLQLSATANYDAGLSENQKANNPVRDALRTQVQRQINNPYLTPTYQQEQDIKAGREVELAQNNTQTPENTGTKGSTSRTLASAGQDITEAQPEKPTQIRQDQKESTGYA